MAHSQSLLLGPGTANSAPYVELSQSLSSQVWAISPFVDEIMRFILIFRNSNGSEMEIQMALHEALVNAVVHGNHENPRKRVYVDCRCCMDGGVSITVRDEGQGFNSNEVPDPTAPENRLFPHGRGIYLMRTLMDEVTFERGGSVVRMRKKSNSGATAQRRSG